MPLQLLLAGLGGVIMLLTGAWLLPGAAFIILLKVLYRYPTLLAWLQGTWVYQAAAGCVLHLSKHLLINTRDKELLAVSIGCATGTTLLTVNIVLRQLAHPDAIPWTAVLLRQAFMAATLVQLFSAKHRESHNRMPTYRHPITQMLLGRVNEWWTGAFYGNVPETDRCGHGFMHHRNEHENDDWGTFHLDRSNAFQFLQYVITAGLWHNSCIGPVVEFARAKCWRVVRQAGVGMAAYYLSGLAVLVLGGWRLFVVLYAWPYVANIGYASVINWAWHAFANPDNPTNYMSSTITAVDWPGDIFQEGFHVPHHLRPSEHYSLMKDHYHSNRDYYVANNCVVLIGTDPLEIWANVLLHQWDYFANRVVDFSGQMSHAQKRAFMRYRTRPSGSKPANAQEAEAVKLAAAAASSAAEATMRLNKAEAEFRASKRTAGRQATLGQSS